MKGVDGLTRLLPAACLMAAICLFASELMASFEFAPPEGIAVEVQSGSDRHGYALAVIALFAIAALMVAVFAGSKPAATAVAVAGVAALLIFLLADLPDANAVGTLNDEGQSYFDAEAMPRGGFWLEMLGAIALTISGIALATLTPEQLIALRPQGGAGQRRGKPGEHEPDAVAHDADADDPQRRSPRRPRTRPHTRGRR